MAIHQIELDAYFQDLVDMLIQNGQYASVEEVLIAGLELLDMQESGEFAQGFGNVMDDEADPDTSEGVDRYTDAPNQNAPSSSRYPGHPNLREQFDPLAPRALQDDARFSSHSSDLSTDQTTDQTTGQTSEKTIGQPVDLPEKVSVAALNTFMDDSLQALIEMLDAKEKEEKDDSPEKN